MVVSRKKFGIDGTFNHVPGCGGCWISRVLPNPETTQGTLKWHEDVYPKKIHVYNICKIQVLKHIKIACIFLIILDHKFVIIGSVCFL